MGNKRKPRNEGAKSPRKVGRVKYKKILYATDLSESGRYAFNHAASLTSQYGSRLTVLHVVEGGPELDRRLFGYVTKELWEEIKQRNLKEATDILQRRKRDDAAISEAVGEYCEDVKDSIKKEAYVTYSVLVKMGDPVEEIMNEAEDGAYDLVVMGTHGHGAVKASIMGDTVRRVVRRSKIPVLVVRVPGMGE